MTEIPSERLVALVPLDVEAVARCPFCGRLPEWYTWPTAGSVGAWLCTTPACPANGKTQTTYSEGTALAHWNRRVPSAPDAEALRSALVEVLGHNLGCHQTVRCCVCRTAQAVAIAQRLRGERKGA